MAKVIIGISIVWLVLTSFFLFRDKSWTVKINHITTFSSPHVADVNNDGVADVIVGLGKLEFHPCDTAVVALNGANGKMLWHVSSRDQMFGSAAFADLNGDHITDVVINGRSAELKAINGKNGKLLWEFFTPKNPLDSARFHNLFNFYNAQFIPDQNEDGYPEILVANGGDVLAPAHEVNRHPGSLMVIDGNKGQLLAKAMMPDQKEIYMSIVTDDLGDDGTLDVIFGTGGETIPGHLFRTTLAEILREDLSASISLATSDTKGFIAPPVLADITGDSIKDIITNAVDGRMIAINGKTNEKLWSITLPGTEAYSSLAVGHFNTDDTPDFFASFATGVWPELSWSKQVLVDGKNGEILFRDSVGYYQTSSPVVADFNGDGRDDVLLNVNYQVVNLIWTYHYNFLMIFDFFNHTTYQVGEPVQGMNTSSTPWIGDLDDDQLMDVIYCVNGDSLKIGLDSGVHIRKLATSIPVNKPIPWGAYMGSNYDGKFVNQTENTLKLFNK